LKKVIFRFRGLWMALAAAATLRVAAPSWASYSLGLALACLGEAIRLWAIGYTGESTRKSSLNAPVLVTGGPYSLVRNPLYVGNLFNAAGVLTAAYGSEVRTLWAGVGLFWLVCLLYRSLIGLEEEFLLARFGEEYRDYCCSVPSLWPRRWRCSGGSGLYSWRTGLRYEWTTLFWWLVIWGLLVSKV
jgi:protein-S-isoprenylcysteine O-methyltransferase Ste14